MEHCCPGMLATGAIFKERQLDNDPTHPSSSAFWQSFAVLLPTVPSCFSSLIFYPFLHQGSPWCDSVGVHWSPISWFFSYLAWLLENHGDGAGSVAPHILANTQTAVQLVWCFGGPQFLVEIPIATSDGKGDIPCSDCQVSINNHYFK